MHFVLLRRDTLPSEKHNIKVDHKVLWGHWKKQWVDLVHILKGFMDNKWERTWCSWDGDKTQTAYDIGKEKKNLKTEQQIVHSTLKSFTRRIVFVWLFCPHPEQILYWLCKPVALFALSNFEGNQTYCIINHPSNLFPCAHPPSQNL